MDKITFDTLPDAVALILQKMNQLQAQIAALQEKPEEEKLMPPAEAAKFLAISKVTLWEWEKQGRIIKHRIGGRTYYKHSELLASLKHITRYGGPAT